MAAKVTVKLDNAGFLAYRQSPECQAMVLDQAEQIAKRANAMARPPSGMGEASYEARGVRSVAHGSVAMVVTGNLAAKADNAANSTLVRAMGT